MSSLCVSDRTDSQEVISDLLQSSRKLAQHHITPTDTGMACNLCGVLTGPWDAASSHPGPSCPVAKFFSDLSAFVRVAGTVLILAAASACAGAEQPHKPLPKVDWALIAADASTRALDAYSTRKMLTDPCGCNHETFLPAAVANHAATMIAFEGVSFAGTLVFARYLRARHHEKLARLVIIADTVQVAPFAIRNLFLGGGEVRRRLLSPAEVR